MMITAMVNGHDYYYDGGHKAMMGESTKMLLVDFADMAEYQCFKHEFL